jgi:hypothetical protein
MSTRLKADHGNRNALDQNEYARDEKFPRVCWRTRGNLEIGSSTQLDLRPNLPAPQNLPLRRPRGSGKPFRALKIRHDWLSCPIAPEEWQRMDRRASPKWGVDIFSRRRKQPPLVGNPRQFKPKSRRGPAVRSCSHFVTRHRILSPRDGKTVGGAGGRPVYFLPEAAPEGICGKPAPRPPVFISNVTP